MSNRSVLREIIGLSAKLKAPYLSGPWVNEVYTSATAMLKREPIKEIIATPRRDGLTNNQRMLRNKELRESKEKQDV